MIELSVQDFLASDDAPLLDRLAHQAIQHFRTNEPAQLRAWAISLRCLRAALAGWPAAAAWHVVLEYPMRRLGRRIGRTGEKGSKDRFHPSHRLRLGGDGLGAGL